MTQNVDALPTFAKLEEEPDASTGRELTGQVALVTGSGRGISRRAIAQRLAGAGAAVAALARSAEQVAETVTLIESAGGRATGIVADVTDFAALQAAVQEIEATLGPLTLLVNNAAVVGHAGPSWEVDADAWWRCQEINLRWPFLCAKAVLPGMAARRQGRIVNVASGASLRPIPYVTAYAVSKTALARWSEILALETAPYNIAVFVINPGDVMTAMAQQVIDEMSDRVPGQNEKFRVPPERAAELVHWLATGKGDALSGRFLSVHYDVEAMAAASQMIGERQLYVLRLGTLE